MSQLESLKKHTKIVADTGDFQLIAEFKPVDSTTNPSLIKQACFLDRYKPLLNEAIAQEANSTLGLDARASRVIDRLTVLFGCEILKIIPGRVSTEIDAGLSYDADRMVTKCLEILQLYSELGIDRDRVYLKIPATWEGVEAARVLKRDHKNVHLNMTLVFSLTQAVACADAGADLISPFVGRISDWFVKTKNLKINSPEEDPGVINVRKIYNYYKKFNIPTTVMGASFRNVGQIKALCGIDALTISPKLLGELSELQGEVPVCLSVQQAVTESVQKIELDETAFKRKLEEDEMAYTKLEEGIKLFLKDTVLLRDDIKKMLS